MSPRNNPAPCLICAVTAFLIGPATAAAQILVTPGPSSIYTPSPTPADQRDLTGPIGVLARPKPELDPQGFWLESVHLLPSLTTAAVYDSNIFATRTSPVSDIIVHLRPQLDVGSGPSLVSYKFSAFGDIARYTRHESLSNSNAGATLGLIGDLAPTFRIESRTFFTYDHLDPASFVLPAPNATLTHLPLHESGGEQLSVIRDIGRWALALSGGYQRDTYQDITIDSVTFQQSQLNESAFNASPKLTYDITPLLRGIVQGDYRHENYANGIFNSNAYAVTTGLDFEFRRLFRGTAVVGYRDHIYDSSAFGSVSGITYGLDLAWYPSEIVTVTLAGKQDFSESLLTSTGGTPATTNAKTIQAQVDCEVLRQVTLSGVVAYENDNYMGTPRRDNVVSAGANLSYLINRYWVANTQYRYLTRNSTEPAFSYDRHQIAVALKLQF